MDKTLFKVGNHRKASIDTRIPLPRHLKKKEMLKLPFGSFKDLLNFH